MHAAATRVELDHILKCGNHRSANEYLRAIWEKLGEDVRREKRLLRMRKSVAPEIPHMRMSPLRAIRNDFSFEVRNRAKKGGLNGDTRP